MEEGKNKNKKANDELIMWQRFFKEYLRYMSHQEIPLMDSYGLIKSVYDSLKAKSKLKTYFTLAVCPIIGNGRSFVNLCRAFSRINGHSEVTNEDIHEAYNLMLESLRTLTQHFDIHDLGLDLSPMLQTVYREIKTLGAPDAQTLSKVIKVKVSTLNNCLEYIERKEIHSANWRSMGCMQR